MRCRMEYATQQSYTIALFFLLCDPLALIRYRKQVDVLFSYLLTYLFSSYFRTTDFHYTAEKVAPHFCFWRET